MSATLHQPLTQVVSSPLSGLGLNIRRPFKTKESPLTLHNAIKLECLSRTRITMEIRDEPRLARIVGHLAVYQKATELILVTKMHQERARRFEEQLQYVEGDVWPEFSCPRKAPAPPSRPSPYSGVVMRAEKNRRVSTPSVIGPKKVPIPVKASYTPAKLAVTEYVEVIDEVTDETFTVPETTECVFSLVHIQQDQRVVLPPVQIQVPRHMSSSAAVQFWHILLQTLSRFYHRKGRPHLAYDIRQLEAYGIHPRMISGGQTFYQEEHFWYDGSVQLVA